MQMFHSATSPFARKCLVAAHELQLRDRIELLAAAPHPVNRDAALVAKNPLGQVPALITPEGMVLYDSRVICEYLNAVAHGLLFPDGGPARWRALTDQSLADGMTDAAVLGRYEASVRPESLRWPQWTEGQVAKISSGLAALSGRVQSLTGRIDVGTIAIGCALGYLDFRYASLGWRDRHPTLAQWFESFAARPSMQATRPPSP